MLDQRFLKAQAAKMGLNPADFDGFDRPKGLKTPTGMRVPGTVVQSSEGPKIIQNDPQYWLKQFITQDPEMIELKRKTLILSAHRDPVLVTGPTGTGKTLIARALHGNRTGAFVRINCGGFPEHLIESELFGHVKGSFTGAWNDKMGLFEYAENGTVFLDEIAELPLLMQTKILIAVEERMIRRVGDTKNIYINCRVVAATHNNLLENIEQKKFREDLYWRLATFVLEITGLDARLNDVPLIAASMKYSEPEPDFTEHLKYGTPYQLSWWNRDWSGNVRQLKQYIRQKQVFPTNPSSNT